MRNSTLSCLIVITLFGCFSAPKKIITANQDKASTQKTSTTAILWKPNVLADDFQVDSFDVFKDVNIGFKLFSDFRAAKGSIGTIKQGDLSKTIIPDKDIGTWCTKNLVNSFRFLGLKPVSKTGTYSFEGEVTSFNIHQDITLRGQIGLSLLFSKEGLTVWEGSIEGQSELYLIPQGSDGVSECLSNALINAAFNLLNDRSFMDAVKKSKE